MKFALKMRCEDGGRETVEIEAASIEEAREMAAKATRDWIEDVDGGWGDQPAEISGDWSLTDEDDDKVAEGNVVVKIEANHAALIKAAARAASVSMSSLCGDEPQDHDWTATVDIDGGCRENPGVWSAGGTVMVYASHCSKCGLRRRERDPGVQRNPGEFATVEYTVVVPDPEEVEATE